MVINLYIISNKKKINVKNCIGFKSRLVGMMFLKEKLNYGLCFPKCNSVHTFFMKQNIDIIMTDKENKILSVWLNIKPWKIKTNKRAYNTYEFSTGIIKNINVGEYLEIKKS